MLAPPQDKGYARSVSNWKNKAEEGMLAGADGFDEKHMVLLDENKKLKRQLQTAQMERDILNEEG